MSLPHAILGFLQVMPLTGYDLKTQAFDRTVAYFWPAVQQQIYRELDRLLVQGLVAQQVEIQQDRPNRKVYSITEAGRQEFGRWLRHVHPPPVYRDAFLIQLFFAAQLSNTEILGLLEGQRAAYAQKLADLQALQASIPPDRMPDRRRTLSLLTLDLGLRQQQMYIDWLDHALATVRAMPEDNGDPGRKNTQPPSP